MTARLPPLLLAALLLAGHAALADEPTLAPVDCWFPVPAGHAAKCYRLTVPESRYGHGRLVAVADSTQVMYDYERQQPIPVSPELAAAMEAFEGRRLR